MIDEFVFFVSELKKIKRSGWKNKLNLNDVESVADHTYVMTVLGMVISDLHGLNTEKIIRMSLLHDLAESITGDIMPNQMTVNDKREKENNAIKQIFDKLPNELYNKYYEMWEELQNKKSNEAKFVHDLDKLEMVIQAKLYQKNGIDKEKIRPFIESASNSIKTDKMKKILKKFIEETR